MKNIMKFVFGLVFSLAFMVTAKAQSDTAGAVPSPDDIVCVQVDENVFECSIMDPNFKEGEPGESEFENQDTAGVDEGFMDEDNPGVMEDYELQEDQSTGEVPSFDTTGMAKEEELKKCQKILEDQDQSKRMEMDQQNQDQSKGLDEQMEDETTSPSCDQSGQ